MADQYKIFKIERLDPISPTFCAAKWLVSDFKLFTGVTSNCHYPYPHKIDLHAVANDLHRINNTDEKISERRAMLNGEKPPGCSNCWQVEDINQGISDRPIQSSMADDGRSFFDLDLSTDQIPSVIKVAFDTLCNFVCSYCDASQSSSWATSLVKDGGYKHIKTDKRNTYSSLGKKNLLSIDEYEFIKTKFIEYIDFCLPNLKSIVILGGEPLSSPNFWQFYDRLTEQEVKHLKLSITTNLSFLEKIKKLSVDRHKFKQINLAVSIDAIGPRAEFIRKGLDWENFEKNLDFSLENGFTVELLATVSCLVVDDLPEFLDWYVKKKNTHRDLKLVLSLIRWPNFQRIQMLPYTIRLDRASKLGDWLKNNIDNIDTMTAHQITNIIDLLRDNNKIIDPVEQQDTKIFFKQYSSRNRLDITSTFSKDISDWLTG